MEEVNQSWTTYFRENENPFHGWVSSLAEADVLIREFEVVTQSHYIVLRETGNFGSFDLSCSHKVKHVDDGKIKRGSQIDNKGIPFMITGRKQLGCHQGSTRQQQKLDEKKDDHNYKQNAHNKKVTGSKKMGCESCIVLREVVLFPDFKPTTPTDHHQRLKSKEIKTALQSTSAEQINYEGRIFIDLPDKDSHSDHLAGDAADIKAPIDGRIVDNIKSLVEDGVKSTGELVRHNKIFVRKLCPQTPSSTNRRFFPSNDDVRKVATSHMKKISQGLVDQDRLQATIPKIKGDGDFIFFRPRGSECDDSQDGRLLFIHQSQWQKRLLSMYGQEMVLLDATYKTSQYALPLFFISVKTNSGYAVVASFVVEREDTVSVTEALLKLQQENQTWNPSAFMIDNSDVEMNAISSTFQEAKIYLCDFHRKQSWLRWIRNHKNQVYNNEEEIMRILNRVAASKTEQEYLRNVEEMKDSAVWKDHPQLQKYLDGHWLRDDKYKKWVCAFRVDGVILINTTNGIEAMNKIFKYDYVKPQKSTTITDLILILMEFLKDQKRKYIDANVKLSIGWRRQGQGVPDIAAHKPLHLQQHLRAIDISSSIENLDTAVTLFPKWNKCEYSCIYFQ